MICRSHDLDVRCIFPCLMGENGETKAEVLERAEISDRQLKSWRSEGLIPTPEQRSLGHGRGTRSVYPSGTAELASEIDEKLDEIRKFSSVGWWLWCEGRDEYTDYVRGYFLSRLRERSDQLEEALQAYREEEPNNPVRKLAHSDRPLYGTGWLRGRLQPKEKFATPVRYGLLGLAGELDSEDFHGEAPEALTDAFQALAWSCFPKGIQRFVGYMLEPEWVADWFLTIFDSVNLPRAEEWFENASDEELLSVRDEVRQCFAEWAPDEVQHLPPGYHLFWLCWSTRQLVPDADVEHPFRFMMNFMFKISHPLFARPAKLLKNLAVLGEVPPTIRLE